MAVCFQHACQADLVSQSNTVQVQRQSGQEQNQQRCNTDREVNKDRTTEKLRQEAGTASKDRADMYKHTEQSRGASEVQAHNQELRRNQKEGMPEMMQPIQQAVVTLAQYTVEFQDQLLRRAH